MGPSRVPACALVAVLLVGVAGARAGSPAGEGLEREATGLLSRYLQIDTTNPPGGETRAAEFFRDLFEGEGIEARVIESAPGRGNIVARLRGDGTRPGLVLMHHLDVVAAEPQFWSVDPFGGEVRDGFVWGRGALDTKGLGIVHAMTLLHLARTGVELGGDVIFLGVADEETGGSMGAGFLVEQHEALFEGVGLVLNEGAAIALDDAGQRLFYGVESSQKVPLWLRLTATGPAGHGSTPRPNAAAHRLVAALHRVAGWETPLRVLPEVQRFYAEIAHRAEPSRRQAYLDLRTALQDPAFARDFTAGLRENAQVRNTISITRLEGSPKTNVISPRASAELDVRLLPDQDPEAFLAELRRVIDDDAIELEALLSFPPATSPADHELFDVIRALAAHSDPGVPVTPTLAVGFTDCHFFRERQIPCYGFAPFRLAPDELQRFHGNDERLSVANLGFGVRFGYELVARLAAAAPEETPALLLDAAAR